MSSEASRCTSSPSQSKRPDHLNDRLGSEAAVRWTITHSTMIGVSAARCTIPKVRRNDPDDHRAARLRPVMMADNANQASYDRITDAVRPTSSARVLSYEAPLVREP